MSERVRIADIAEELGVSTATVSNVIHGKTKKISDETVKRVQELLEQRQYIPSMAGILLAQNDSRIIGVVVNDHKKYEGHVLEDGFIASSLNHLASEIENYGCFMMVKVTEKWEEIARIASMWNMVGLVVIGFCEQDYRKLRETMHIPFVVYDGYFAEPGRLSNIMVDNYGGGHQMGVYLRRMGHRKILCISDNRICMDLERYQGFCAAFKEAEEEEPRLLLVPMEREARQRFYQEKMEELLQHTAIFAMSDYYALDVLHFLQRQGIRVPEEISVAGFDDCASGSQNYPALTTIRQDGAKRAELAMQLLTELRKDAHAGKTILLHTTLVERESVLRIFF